MSGFFYNLGKKAGPAIRKAHWAWTTATAPEAQVISAERAVGADMARTVRTMCPPCPDAEIKRMLDEIGLSLQKHLRNARHTFEIECIHSPQPQAFCLPGGFVFISDAMLSLCQNNPDMIAFILGHEMAHVVKGHAMQRMIVHAVISTASKTAPVPHAAAGVLQRLGVRFLQSAYSQEDEWQADELGYRLAVAAGFSRQGAMDLFNRLKQHEQTPLLGRYFSTHPPCQSRMEHLTKTP